MKILYDHQIFTTQKYGGISRYFYELIKLFRAYDNIDAEISLLFSNNYYISNSDDISYFNFFDTKEFRGKTRLMSELNKLKTIYYLKKQDFDVFHPTYYDPYFLKYLGNKPFVLTVYDMIHEKFHKSFLDKDKTALNKKILIEKASKIIAISENTKKDLIQSYGIEESRIEVVYLGNSMFPPKKVIIHFELPKKYILFVGSRRGYKNFEKFIISVSELLNKDRELFIVCAGGGNFTDGEIQLLSKLSIRDQVYQHNVDDDSLAYIYQNAQLFVFPSLYEGFGIPVLESFACNCPLLCSNVSSLPEIAGDGAIYFDPNGEESIKSAVENVLKDKELRDSLIENGIKQLKQFSWQETALQTKKIYESIVK